MYFQAASTPSRVFSNPTRNVLIRVVNSIAIQYTPMLFINGPSNIVSANPAKRA